MTVRLRSAGAEFIPMALCLIGGAVCLLVTFKGWLVPPAAWIAPILLLHFVNRTRPMIGLTTLAVVITVIGWIGWREIIPAPGTLYYLIASIYAAVNFIPYVAHRTLSHRLLSPWACLVFPTAWVGIEYLFQQWVTPYGTWMSLAYTRSPHDALSQVAALAGTAGVTFLLVWGASTAAQVWQDIERGQFTTRTAVPFAVVLSAALVFGAIRTVTPAPQTGSVQTVLLTPSRTLARTFFKALAPLQSGREPSEQEWRDLRESADAMNNDLLAQTDRYAQAGARIVAWSETAARVLAEDEETFLVLARDIARNRRIHLFVGLGTWHRGRAIPADNKVVAIDPQGAIAAVYLKAHPIVGGESSFTARGDGRLGLVETPYGRVAIAICHDLDFPDLLLQAHRAGAALLIGPAADWPAIGALHSRMAAMRAIENGLTEIRPASGGISSVVDARGRMQVSVAGDDNAVAVSVPIGRARVFYPLAPHAAGVASLIALCALIVAGRRKAVRVSAGSSSVNHP